MNLLALQQAQLPVLLGALRRRVGRLVRFAEAFRRWVLLGKWVQAGAGSYHLGVCFSLPQGGEDEVLARL